MAKTEVDTRDFSELRPWEQTLRELHGRTSIENGSSSFDIATDVADKIMEAESLDEVMAIPQQGLGGLDDIAGKAFQFIGGSLAWARSSEQYREGGTGFYAIFSVRMLDGTEERVSTGAVNVVFQLRKMEKIGAFPETDGELTEKHFTIGSRTVASGTLYWLQYA